MTAIVTTRTSLFNARQLSNAFIDGNSYQYLFIGRPQGWANENAPDTPIDSTSVMNDSRRDMIAAKLIQPTDVSLGILRRNWQTGKYYDFYRHDYGASGVHGVNINDGSETTPTSEFDANFFVVTDEFHVYKCIWNGGGSVSTVKPTGTSTTKFTTADGYVWKYMYSVSSADTVKFVTVDFVPVRELGSNPGSSNSYYTQWLVQQASVAGQLDIIVLNTGGSGYPVSTTFPITISGDGTGATATASTNSSGVITSVSVTNPGQGYTRATVSFPTGTGATATVIIPPLGGHGSSAAKELGARYVVTDTVLSYIEGGTDFPTVNEYRRIGILANPTQFGVSTQFTAATADATTRITLSAGVSGTFLPDDVITGGTSGATAFVVSYDPTSRVLQTLKLSTNSGTFQVGETITGSVSGASGIVAVKTNPEIDIWSGDIIYLEHRRPISRHPDQQEDIKIVIEC